MATDADLELVNYYVAAFFRDVGSLSRIVRLGDADLRIVRLGDADLRIVRLGDADLRIGPFRVTESDLSSWHEPIPDFRP